MDGNDRDLYLLTPAYHRAGRSKLVCRGAAWLFRRWGWRLEGGVPGDSKMILVVGPHTSNWDFVVAVLAMLAMDIRLHFLAKHTLFVGPLGAFMRALGGIPVNRSNPGGFAGDAAALISRSPELILAITPEGTRSPVKRLKTGFSRIASEVPCPLVPVLLDFGCKSIRLMEPRAAQLPEADECTYRQLFAGVAPKRPKNFLSR